MKQTSPKDLQTLNDLQRFNEYMLSTLESSRNYRARLEQRNQQAINFFLIMLTALGSGLIALITLVKAPTPSLLFSALASILIGVFGFLTYFWLLTSACNNTSFSFS